MKIVKIVLICLALIIAIVMTNNVRADCLSCKDRNNPACVSDTDTVIIHDTLIDTLEIPIPYDTPDTICQYFQIYQMAEICTLFDAGTVSGNCENNYHVGLQDTLSDTNLCRLLIEPFDPMCSRQVEQITEIITATLYIYALYAPAQPTDSILAYDVNSQWIASECDWEYRKTDTTWVVGGGDVTFLGGIEIMPADSGWFAIDVTVPMQNWLAGTSFGIMLESEEATYFDYCIFQHPSMCGCPTCPYIEVDFVLEGEGEPQ